MVVMAPIWLLAQGNPFEKMQQHLGRPTSVWELVVLLLLVVAAASIWAVLWAWERQRQPQQVKPQPERRTLAQQLCEAHGLSSDDAGMLTDLAARLQLSDPMLLFVDPRLLEQIASTDDPAASSARSLGQRLFAGEFSPVAS
jgi:hypothetical protein